jgi:hypothetical protein
MKRLFVKGIKKVPVGVGTELIVQVENVYEDVEVHKKVKKHHRRNKQPAWFKEFVDTVFLPTIAEIKQDITEIKVTLAEHGKRLDAIEAKLEEHGKRLDKIEDCLKRNNIV